MNILLTNISVLPPRERAKTIEYRILVTGCDVSCIKAIHTNESILKCFAEIREIKTSGGLNRIIAMVSNKAKKPQPSWDDKSAYDYYKDRVKEQYPMITPEIIEIPIENDKDEPLPTSKILSDICKYIDPYDKVYIDSAGGLRTISNLVQLLSKILNYIGVETPCTLYSDINNTPTIVDTADFTRMARLADAFNEFMTSGKSDQLKSCFNNPSQDVETLLDAMCEFSDKFRLGSVDDLDKTIGALKAAIGRCQEIQNDNEVEFVILKRFLPVIQKKLLSDESSGVDYCKIVQWCLDNLLIQQALTVFVEKIPSFFFSSGILSCADMEQKKKNYQVNRKLNPNWPADWEHYALYQELMKPLPPTDNPLVIEFENALLYGYTVTDPKVKQAVKLVNEYKKFKRPVKPHSKDDRDIKLVEFINKNTFIDHQGYVKSLCNQPNLVLELVGGSAEKMNTLEKKFIAVEEIAKGKNKGSDYHFQIRPDQLAKALYAYLYVKPTRNQIAHASSDENLNHNQQLILSEYGYDFSNYDLKTVKSNIQNALNAIKEAAKQVKDKEKPEKKVIKTELPKIELKILGKIEL